MMEKRNILRKTPSIRDVASRAHVSAATVSRVINGNAGVNDITRQKVWQAVREIDYEIIRSPDALAGIVVIAPMVSFHNTYWRFAMSGILEEASRLQIPVQFPSTLTKRDVQQYIKAHSPRDGLLGVIFACFPMEVNPDRWIPDTADAVSVCLLMQSSGHRISMNVRDAIRKTTHRLATLGHRHIAFTINALGYAAQYARLQGYIQACRELDIEPDVALIAPNEKAGTWLEERLQDTAPPTAIIGGTSELSQHVFSYALKKGLNMPEDIAFVGVGHASPVEKPIYDTILQPTFTAGVEAVRMLRQVVIRPGGPIRNVELPVSYSRQGTVSHR